MDIQIRFWRIEDAEQLVDIVNNKNIQNNLRDGVPYPYTLIDARNFISGVLKCNQNETFAFAVSVDDRLVGSIGVFRQQNIHFKSAEMGYYIAEEFWGKGLGSAAIRKTLEYVFDKTDIVRVFAEPFADNIASCRILEKNGFVLEGILRKNAFKNGQFLDMKMYAILKESFMAK